MREQHSLVNPQGERISRARNARGRRYGNWDAAYIDTDGERACDSNGVVAYADVVMPTPRVPIVSWEAIEWKDRHSGDNVTKLKIRITYASGRTGVLPPSFGARTSLKVHGPLSLGYGR
jgi:hypothetical protein